MFLNSELVLEEFTRAREGFKSYFELTEATESWNSLREFIHTPGRVYDTKRELTSVKEDLRNFDLKVHTLTFVLLMFFKRSLIKFTSVLNEFEST